MSANATGAGSVRRVSLAYDRRGAGEPLVLLHGIGSRWQIWSRVLPRLAEHHEIWAVDLPGFGASPPLAEGRRADIDGLSGSIVAFLDEHGLDRPHFAGHSTGGGVALDLAARGAARSATAVAPIGFWSARERAWCQASLRASRRLLGVIGPALPALVASPAGRTLLFGQNFARPWRIEPREALDSIAAFAGAAAFDETLSAFAGWLAPIGAADVAPVTVAWGDRDLLLLPRQARRARLRLPRARHVTLRGCGHAAMVDDPEAVADVVLATATASDGG